jgi:putative copper export protein
VIALLRFAHLVAVAVWVGSIVFFSFVAAPSIFGALPREMAGRAVAVIFPRYYLLGGAGGGAALLTAILRGVARGRFGRALGLEALLLLAMLGLTAYAGLVVLPRAAAIRETLPRLEGTEGYAEAKTRFDALHARSVGLNGAVLLLGLAAIACLAADPSG